LPELLAPRWRAASTGTRKRLRVAMGVFVLVVIAVAILFPREPSIAFSGRAVSFNLHYPRTFHRVTPPPGAYSRIEQRDAAGRLLRWFEVDRLTLPPFTGEISGILPVYTTSYAAGLAAHLAGFTLQTETKTRVNQVPGYTLTYSFLEGGRRYFGRSVMLVDALSGLRDGVLLTMATVPGKLTPGPDQVGGLDALEVPFRSFRLGT
jgi:hypothetical protein